MFRFWINFQGAISSLTGRELLFTRHHRILLYTWTFQTVVRNRSKSCKHFFFMDWPRRPFHAPLSKVKITFFKKTYTFSNSFYERALSTAEELSSWSSPAASGLDWTQDWLLFLASMWLNKTFRWERVLASKVIVLT